MSGSSAESRLIYKTRMPRSARQLIYELADATWQTGSTTLTFVTAIEGVWALRKGAAISLASKLSIVALPIVAFQFGTWLREQIDDDEGHEIYDKARFLILDLSIENATDVYFQQHPDSLIRDNTAIYHMRMQSGNSNQKAMVSTWGLAYRKWWDRLGDELDQFRKLGHMADISDLWKAYVLRVFNEITHEFLGYLSTAESLGGFGSHSRTLSEDEASHFGL